VIISCPECGTGYLLPESLMGPGGASVRCPRCQRHFVVEPRGRSPEPAVTPEIAASDVPSAPISLDPLTVARAVLERMSREQGEAIEQARRAHRFFAEHGPALMEAFEAYRREAGEDAGPGPFREALRERWGVELLPLSSVGD